MDISKFIVEQEKRVDISEFFKSALGDNDAEIIIKKIPEFDLRLLKTYSSKRLDTKMIIESKKVIEDLSFQNGLDLTKKPDNEEDLKKWLVKKSEIESLATQKVTEYVQSLTLEELQEATKAETETEKLWLSLGIKSHNLTDNGKLINLDYSFWNTIGKSISLRGKKLKDYVLDNIILFNITETLGE